jgi:hypothetical protein
VGEQPQPSRFRERACALCGEVFRSREPMKKYCSAICRVKANEGRRGTLKYGGPVKIDINAADTPPWEERRT